MNRALERAGLEVRVDRRSLKEQGIEREPEPKMGPALTQKYKVGIKTEVGRLVESLRLEREASLAVKRLTRELEELAERAKVVQRREREIKRGRQTDSLTRKGRAAKLNNDQKREYKRTVDLITDRTKNERGETEFRYKSTQKLVFVDRGQRIDLEVITPIAVRAALQAAQEKGWATINARGSEESRREMWLQGQYIGMEVSRYKAREADRALVQHMIELKEARKAKDQQLKFTEREWYELEVVKASDVIKKFDERLKFRRRDDDRLKEEREALGGRLNIAKYPYNEWEYPKPLTYEQAREQARAEFVGKEKLKSLLEKMNELEQKETALAEDMGDRGTIGKLLSKEGKELRAVRKDYEAAEKELKGVAEIAKSPKNAKQIERLTTEIMKADQSRQEAFEILEGRLKERERLKQQFEVMRPYLKELAQASPDLQMVVERSSSTGFYRIKNEEHVKNLGQQIAIDRQMQEREKKLAKERERGPKGLRRSRGGRGDDEGGLGL